MTASVNDQVNWLVGKWDCGVSKIFQCNKAGLFSRNTDGGHMQGGDSLVVMMRSVRPKLQCQNIQG